MPGQQAEAVDRHGFAEFAKAAFLAIAGEIGIPVRVDANVRVIADDARVGAESQLCLGLEAVQGDVAGVAVTIGVCRDGR